MDVGGIALGDKIQESEEYINQFNTLLNEYGEEIKRLIFTYVHDYAVTDDLVQEVFISVYKKLDQFEGRSNHKTWLYRIAINKCKDYLRSPKRKYQQLMDSFNIRAKKDTESTVLEAERNNELIQEVMKLPVKYREIIIFYYYQDFSMKEITEILDINMNTVKTRLSRAKDKLKSSLIEGGFSSHEYR